MLAREGEVRKNTQMSLLALPYQGFPTASCSHQGAKDKTHVDFGDQAQNSQGKIMEPTFVLVNTHDHQGRTSPTPRLLQSLSHFPFQKGHLDTLTPGLLNLSSSSSCQAPDPINWLNSILSGLPTTLMLPNPMVSSLFLSYLNSQQLGAMWTISSPLK